MPERQFHVLLVIIALIIGVYTGTLIEKHNSKNSDETSMEMQKADHDDFGHKHEQIEAEIPAPVIDLDVTQDPLGSWNAKISFANFTLSPENVGKADITGQGHAHIYIDGEKINRVYGEWYHLGELPEGEHVISVTLSTNSHKELTKDGLLIFASKTIIVGSSSPMDHQMESMEETMPQS